MPPQNQPLGNRPSRPYPEVDRIRWNPIWPPDPNSVPGVSPPRRPTAWPRVVAFVLFALGIGIAAAFFREIYAFFSTIGRLGDHPTEREMFIGFVAVGFAFVCILAVLRIVLAAQQNRH